MNTYIMQRTLSGLKRAGTLEKWKTKQGQRLVHIWSDEWGAYWRQNASGYSRSIDQAGIYTLAEAVELTEHCGSEKKIVYRFIGAIDS